MSGDNGRICLKAENAAAEISLTGAELKSWSINGRALLWPGDEVWWDRSAPVLFPVVGASRDGHVTIDGKSYPMPLHGFAKDGIFRVVEQQPALVRLRLEGDAGSHTYFPFDFTLDVTFVLFDTELTLSFEVTNSGSADFPYALGYHPGFLWAGQGGLEFQHTERAEVPCIAPGGLIARRTRGLAMQQNRLPLNPDSFANGALVFRNAQSDTLSLTGAPGTVRLRMEGFCHFAVWSRPQAPFVCLEAWTAHADWDDRCGELAERDDMIVLAQGQRRRHTLSLQYHLA